MQLNYFNNTIELTPAEAKKASKIGTKLFNQLAETRKVFTNFRVVVIVPNKSKRTDTLKGLTYEFMDNYVAEHANEEQFKEYSKLREKDIASGKAVMYYGEIKQWFVKQFPEILNKRKELKSKIAASASTTTKEIA